MLSVRIFTQKKCSWSVSLIVTYRALDAAPLVLAGGGVVARQRGRHAAAAAEDGAAVAHVGDEELTVLHQRRRRACTAAYTLHIYMHNTGVPAD